MPVPIDLVLPHGGVQLHLGELVLNQRYVSATEGSLLFLFNIGDSEVRYRDDPINRSSTWYEDNRYDGITILGAGTYLFAGASFSVGFDIVSFLKELEEIFGKG